MWVVGYLYNNNGMGTWCWEAAHALAEAGEAVTLVCSAEVELPGPTTIPILRVSPTALPGGLARLLAPGGMLAEQGPRVMRTAVDRLTAEGTRPTILLLNSTELFDAGVGVPQLVTAWASGVRLQDYLVRLGRHHLRGLTRDSARSVVQTVGWWRRDWYGYTNADVVLAVTSPLADELKGLGVNARVLHPCTQAAAEPPEMRAHDARVRLITAAVHLDEPRKRVLWMLEALRGLENLNCTLTLVGAATDRVRGLASDLDISVEFTGSLSRNDVVRTMRAHDVFLFASVLDDWGYVVTEAMGQGLAVVAPGISPFDEILDDTGVLYDVNSESSFREGVASVVRSVTVQRQRCWSRAQTELSRGAFVSRLQAIVSETGVAGR